MKPIRYMPYITAFCLIAVSTFGQTAVPKRPVFDVIEHNQNNSDTDKFAVIRQLLAQGGYISAANMLEGMYEQNPDDRNIINLLNLCYNELKAFPKAEMLLKRQLEKNPNDYLFQFQLLEIYLKTGPDSLINYQINNILERFPGDITVFQNTIQVLIRENYPELGINIISRARTELNDNKLFGLQLASLYETRQMYYDAVMEYFRATQEDSVLADEADRKTAVLIRYPLAPKDVIRAFKHILDSLPNNTYALKYLSETYIREGKYLDAFNAVVRIDSVEGQDGKELLGYIHQCRERNLYEQVLMASDYVERMYPKSNILENFKIYRAEAFRGLGRPYEAIQTYQSIVDSSVNRRELYAMLIEIADIYRYDLILYDSAGIFYDSVVNRCPYGHIVYRAKMEKAKLYLSEGKLDEAAEAFEALKSGKTTDDQAEFIDYSLAMIVFMKKDFEKADLMFRQMMSQYPRGVYLNDALINSLIIGESFPIAPDLLSDYADALLYDFRLLPDSMEYSLEEIIDQRSSPLTGLVYYKLSSFYEENGRDNEALELIDKMESDLSNDYFYPYCLKIRADIYSKNDANRMEASEIYRLILTDYNNYPFLGEIRKKLQVLEGYQTPG